VETLKNSQKLPIAFGVQAKLKLKLKLIQRWGGSRKREIVLRLLRGESLDIVSREIRSYRP
jgi:hypothetical protein